MTQVVKGRRYYDTCGKRWRVIEVTKDHAVLRRSLVLHTSAQLKEDGKWRLNYDFYGYGFVDVYLIVEGDRWQRSAGARTASGTWT